MPEAPKFTAATPPPEGRSARARGPVTPPDAEDVVASTEPDDDLAELLDESAKKLESPSRWKDGDTVLIHVLADGFTANGRVWYLGQELEFEVGSEAYKDTCDRHGRSWLELDAAQQFQRYGAVQFAYGPWPGGEYENTKAQEAERLRNRIPPTIGKLSASSRT